MTTSQSPAGHAAVHAVDVETKEIYWPAKRPGWASWVAAWQDESRNLYVAFQELRRGSNPLWEAVPLDFWESMALPHGYHETLCNGSKDLINEYVVLKSTDLGESWLELLREPTKLTATFSWVSSRSGMIRSVCNDCVAWHPGDKQETWSEISSDGGKSWRRQSGIMECHNGSGCPHRLRRLRDGTLVQFISAVTPYGPGRERFSRHTTRPGVRQELTCCLFFSADDGKTWTGPCCVFPGILAYEADFVELPSGDLLLLNSNVQGAAQVRQYVKRGPWGWIPGPVYDVVHGRIPECLVYTKSGLIVGAVRGSASSGHTGEYTCSNDEGATWHKIEGLPTCGYQPYITELPDGRIFCVWHGGGGDVEFGQNDMHIGAHVFRLDAKRIPTPTALSMRREKTENGKKYINSYIATLVADGRPVAGKTIRFGYKMNAADPWTDFFADTDQNGQAQLDLRQRFPDEATRTGAYWLKSWFEPKNTNTPFSPCEGNNYFAYWITTTKLELDGKA